MLYSEDDASGPLAAEIKEIESKALAEVGGYINDESRSRRDTLNPAVEWEEVRLDGSFPRTRLIALFKWAGFPDAPCGNWVALWRPDGRRPGKWVYDRWSVHDS